MAFSKISLALGVLLFITLVSADAPTKCYTCASCDEDKNESSVACETPNKGYCFIERVGTDKWKRGCTSKADYCTTVATNKEKCSVCSDKDDCNSSSSVVASVILSTAALVFLKMNY